MTHQDARPQSRPCPHCHIGSLSMDDGVYTGVHSGMFLSAPNVKRWECDVCGFREFDAASLATLNALVGHMQIPRDQTRQNAKSAPKEIDDAAGDVPGVHPFKP